MEEVSGKLDSDYTTALLTLVLAQVVDALMLHQDVARIPGLSQRLLEEWYEGELASETKAHLCQRLTAAATEIARTTYPATRLAAVRRYAQDFSAEIHSL